MKKKTPIFLSIAGTFLSAAAFVFFHFRKGSQHENNSHPADQKSSRKTNIPPSTLYKTKGIKKVEIKTTQQSIPSGIFWGQAKVRPDEHDKYNVDILSNEKGLVGHIEKNRRLSNSLTAWHNGGVFAFWRIQGNGNDEEVTGKTFAFIPAGLTDKEIEEIKEALEKLNERDTALSKPEISSQSYLKILDNHQLIFEIFKKHELLNEIDISLSKRLIPALSKQLEEEENWDGLLELEKHSNLIDELSERFAGVTYRRISKARKMKGIKQ